MAFSRPTLKELWQTANSDITSQLGAGSPLRRSLISAIAYALAGIAHLLYGFQDWTYRQIFPDTSDDENVLRHASGSNVERKHGIFTQVEVLFTGSNGSILQSGTVLSRADGVQYVTQSDVTILDGVGKCLALSVEYGSNSNIPSGAKLSLLENFAGISSQAEVSADQYVPGEDEETIESVLERLLDVKRNPPHGGNENDYQQWAKEVPGVTRAFVYPKRMGPATVGISFLMDNAEDIIPSPAKVAEVQSYIDTLRPVTAEVWVFAPESQTVDFVINLSPNNQATRTEVENEIRDLFKREAKPDGTMPISKINEAISIALGEDDHILVSPNANVEPDDGKILVPGAFEFHEL